jgi:hypothetical protein
MILTNPRKRLLMMLQLIFITTALLPTISYQQQPPWLFIQNTNYPVTKMMTTQLTTTTVSHELFLIAGTNIWATQNNMTTWNNISSILPAGLSTVGSVAILVNNDSDISFHFTSSQDNSLYQFNSTTANPYNLSHYIPPQGETIISAAVNPLINNNILFFYNQTVDAQGHFSSPGKSATFQHLLVNNSFTGELFHVLTIHTQEQNKWFEVYRPLFNFPSILISPPNNKNLNVICQVVSTANKNERAVLFGTYQVYSNVPATFQPVIQALSIPDVANPFSTKTSVTIGNIGCLNCTFITSILLTSQVRTETLIFIILSSPANKSPQSKNQIWIASAQNGKISRQASKLKFNHTDQLLFAVKCINYDETEGIIAVSANNLYWFNVSRYATRMSWETPTTWESLNISSRMLNGVNITSVISNTINMPNSSNTSKNVSKPCILIGLSNGTVLLFYWTGDVDIKKNFSLTSLTPGNYLPDEAITSMVINANASVNTVLYIGTSAGKIYWLNTMYTFLSPNFPENLAQMTLKIHNQQGEKIKVYRQLMEQWSWATIIQSLEEFYYNKRTTQCSLFTSHFQDWIYQYGINCCFGSNRHISSYEYQLCNTLDEIDPLELMTALMDDHRINTKLIPGQALTINMIRNQLAKNRPMVLWANSDQYLLIHGFSQSTNEDYLFLDVWDPSKGVNMNLTLSELNSYEVDGTLNIYAVSYSLFTSA